jgi:hypothetical protein
VSISFREFATIQRKRRIIMLHVNEETQKSLVSWAKRAGFDLTKKWGGATIDASEFNFHLTLIASENGVFHPKPAEHLMDPLKLKATSMTTMGEEKDTPVLKIHQNDQLDTMLDYYKKVFGLRSTWPTFRPHISVSYSWKGTPVLKDVDLPKFPLVFDRITIEDFEE